MGGAHPRILSIQVNPGSNQNPGLGSVGLATLHPRPIATNSLAFASDDQPSFIPSRPLLAPGLRNDQRLNLIDQGSLRIATWNVLTLNFPGAKTFLAMELKRFRISIAGITETHLVGNGNDPIGEGYHLLWSGQTTTRRNGVGLVLYDKSKKCLLSFTPVSDRIANARLNHKQGKMTVLVCNAPTNEADTETKDTFYSALTNELSKISPHDIVILLGDLNATVSDKHDLWRQVIGPVTPDSLNDNGLRLLQLCSMPNLVITNTMFARKEIHKYTWYSNDGHTKKINDYIIVTKR